MMKNEMKLNREDMLELTRRMTLKRTCFTRIAGAYFDGEGFLDGTFNVNFLDLPASERSRNMAIAKVIPFAETNVELKGHRFRAEEQAAGSVWQMLMALKACELKNDALLDIFYDLISEKHPAGKPYAVYLFYGCYDVPLKARDGERLEDSEEVYSFIICTVGPYHGDYEPEMPEWGFIFPAFIDRSSDVNGIAVYKEEQMSGGYL